MLEVYKKEMVLLCKKIQCCCKQKILVRPHKNYLHNFIRNSKKDFILKEAIVLFGDGREDNDFFSDSPLPSPTFW